MQDDTTPLVSADWLHRHLHDNRLRLVDASWYLSARGQEPLRQFEAAHIEGAVFFDQERVVDPASHLPHTIPTPADFARHVGAMGVSEQDRIVVYEREGYFAAPRVWFLFKIMGAARVCVLDGGLAGWMARGFPVTNIPTRIKPVTFRPHFQEQAIVTLAQMREIVAKSTVQIADARGMGRFTGQEPEPRPGMRAGHMPGARNVPYHTLVQDGYFKSVEGVRAAFSSAGIDVDKPVVTSCGSGVTAAVLALGLELLGNRQIRLYDGSWSEWGALTDTQVEKGEG